MLTVEIGFDRGSQGSIRAILNLIEIPISVVSVSLLRNITTLNQCINHQRQFSIRIIKEVILYLGIRMFGEILIIAWRDPIILRRTGN